MSTSPTRPPKIQPTPVVQTLITASGGVIGAGLFTILFLPDARLREYTRLDLAWDLAILSAGVLLGSWFFSWANKR